ncbi:MAG: GNAT family N-acetyltransferase [Candidatus Heimdallarchaeota archaeon]
MTFNPVDYSVKKQFGNNWFHIRPAKSSDRDLVWQGYQDAPQEFFSHLNPISIDAINHWYPQGVELDYKHSLPFNAMLLDDSQNEVAFAGNMTLIFSQSPRYKHRAHMGLSVLPKFQKLGIGSYLTQLSVTVAKAKPGIYRLELEVNTSNYARKIYPKFGYQQEAVLQKVFLMDDGSLEDVIVMSIVFSDKKL